jgi:hypothetical protein
MDNVVPPRDAWGKAKEFDPKSLEDVSAPKFDPSKLTPDQLEFVKQALVLVIQTTEPADGRAESREQAANCSQLPQPKSQQNQPSDY